jgi:YfiH family protein
MTSSAPNWLRRLPEAARPFWRHGWTTKSGPEFLCPPTSPQHAAAVARLVAAAGLQDGAWVQQVHGGKVLRATTAGYLGQADALWTTEPGLGVIGRSADCPLVLVAGPNHWGFAHASWRSTVAGITATLLRDMTAAGLNPRQARAVICPSAGPCCYEVGPEVQEAAVAQLGAGILDCFPTLGPRPAFDLWRANRAVLAAAGLPAAQIYTTGQCTICGGDDYPSYRREQDQAGRFAAISGGPVQPEATR